MFMEIVEKIYENGSLELRHSDSPVELHNQGGGTTTRNITPVLVVRMVVKCLASASFLGRFVKYLVYE